MVGRVLAPIHTRALSHERWIHMYEREYVHAGVERDYMFKNASALPFAATTVLYRFSWKSVLLNFLIIKWNKSLSLFHLYTAFSFNIYFSMSCCNILCSIRVSNLSMLCFVTLIIFCIDSVLDMEHYLSEITICLHGYTRCFQRHFTRSHILFWRNYDRFAAGEIRW